MKQSTLILFMLVNGLAGIGQKHQPIYWSLAITNSQPAMPFGKFAALFVQDVHPGVEGGFELTWKQKPHHDWFQDFRAGYFFHRFVQHAIPVYTNLGYRYKFSKSLSSELMIGGGYQHVIPATDQFKMDEQGNYKGAKGIGRMQAILTTNVRVSYTVNEKRKRPLRAFIQYHQKLQTPFIREYVPLLPYNVMMIGCSWQILPSIKK